MNEVVRSLYRISKSLMIRRLQPFRNTVDSKSLTSKFSKYWHLEFLPFRTIRKTKNFFDFPKTFPSMDISGSYEKLFELGSEP